MGIEPTTSSLGSLRSTTELHPPGQAPRLTGAKRKSSMQTGGKAGQDLGECLGRNVGRLGAASGGLGVGCGVR